MSIDVARFLFASASWIGPFHTVLFSDPKHLKNHGMRYSSIVGVSHGFVVGARHGSVVGMRYCFVVGVRHGSVLWCFIHLLPFFAFDLAFSFWACKSWVQALCSVAVTCEYFSAFTNAVLDARHSLPILRVVPYGLFSVYSI